MRNGYLVVVRLGGSHLAAGDCRVVVTDLSFYYLKCDCWHSVSVKNV